MYTLEKYPLKFIKDYNEREVGHMRAMWKCIVCGIHDDINKCRICSICTPEFHSKIHGNMFT